MIAKCSIKGMTFCLNPGWIMTAALLPCTILLSDVEILLPAPPVESSAEVVCKSCHFSLFGPGFSTAIVLILGACCVTEEGRMVYCGWENFHIHIMTRKIREERSWIRARFFRCSTGSMISKCSDNKKYRYDVQ